MKSLSIWHDPKPEEIPATVEDFLAKLGGPTVIIISGKNNTTRARAVVTLLHGNEPSGTKAIHHWLRSGIKPTVNMHCIIASVQLALIEPGFYYRHLPTARDLNRCFRPPFHGPEGELAKAILDYLFALQPECLLDIHNTSGSGPNFGVAIDDDPKHKALCSLFANRMMISSIRVGALMEISEIAIPTATIECGGAIDQTADIVAMGGLQLYMHKPDVLTLEPAEWDMMEVLYDPIRIEVAPEATVSYGHELNPEFDVTLWSNLEHYNSGSIHEDSLIGWLKNGDLGLINAKDALGNRQTENMFQIKNNHLYPSRPLRLFMATTNASIAKSDCICYAVFDKRREDML